MLPTRFRAFSRRPWAGPLALAFAALMTFPGAAEAQTPSAPVQRVVPESRAQVEFSYAPVVKKVAPAVVNIYSRTVEAERMRSPLFDDPLWRRFFPEGFGAGPVRKQVRTSLGSGVIVAPNGTIITNVHVIKNAQEIRVVLADRREFDAHVVLTDPRTDLAVLHINVGNEKLPYLKLYDSDKLEVGDIVLAIGDPFGVGQTVTSGIVSGLARTSVGVADYRFFIQTDAAINPGNSGGALVTLDGRLAGINTAIYSRSGGSVGIGFAIPSSMVRAVLRAVANGGRVVRPWLGASGHRVTAPEAKSLGLSRPRGVLVTRVDRASPAAAAGLRHGDIVTDVNGLEVDDVEALRFRLATLSVGGTATLSVIRNGQARTLRIALKAPPETPPPDKTVITGANPLSGATVVNLSPTMADQLLLPLDLRGVAIVEVAQNGIAARVGLQPKDLVRAINGRKVSSVAGLENVLTANANAPRWEVTLERNGRTINVTIGGAQ